jgi:glyoxylase-like metal-dependent hydrolase (beta-lactamase superfamily II)
MHKDDLFLVNNARAQADLFGIEIPALPGIDQFISEDTILKIGGTELKFIHTPGHSPGSVCMIDDKNKNVFCGDVVFKNSVGRTDLQGGNMEVLIDSIKNRLFKTCGDDYTLYPGHMEVTNIGDEKKYNPFL